MTDGITEANRGTYFASDHRDTRFKQASKTLKQEEKSMSKSRVVTFTRASETDLGVTVTANRLAEAGFKIDANKLLKGQRFRATLTDARGNSYTVTLTVNRAKTGGNKSTTLYSNEITSSSFSQPYVGVSRKYTVSNLRAI